jgi:hypothetical protein
MLGNLSTPGRLNGQTTGLRESTAMVELAPVGPSPTPHPG